MVEYKKAELINLIEDAKKNDRVDYLKSLAKKEVKGKNGKRKISFLELRRQYYAEFYEDLLPKSSKKKETFWETIENL